MMSRLLRGVPVFFIYLTSAIAFFSLSSPQPTAVSVLILAGGAALFCLCFQHLRGEWGFGRSRFAFGLALLILWFWIHQLALQAALLPISYKPNWLIWTEFVSMFSCAAVLMLCAEASFCDRSVTLRFFRFFVLMGAAAALYFIYLFSVAGVPVERLRPPFILLEHLGFLSPVTFQPNNFIDLLIVPFFFSLALLFYTHRRKLSFPDPSRQHSEIILNLCASSVLLAAIFFTKSRAGILAFAPACAVFFFLFAMAQRSRKSLWRMTLLITFTAVVFLGASGIKDVFQELMTLGQLGKNAQEFSGLRFMTIGLSWEMMKENLFWGAGLGQFQMAWIFFPKSAYTMFPERSYNDFLWFGAETGLAGLVLLGALVFRVYWTGIRLILKSPSSLVAYFSAASLASLSAFLVHSLVDPTLYVAALLWEISIVMGLVGGLAGLDAAEAQQGNSSGQPGKFPKSLNSARPLALLFLMLMPLTFLGAGRVAASFLTSGSPTLEGIEKAGKADFLNGYYDRAASSLYLARFQQNPADRDSLERAVQSIDEALDKEPLNVGLYKKRAEILHAAGESARAEESFVKMQEKLPGFYLAHAVMFAFYLERSLEEASPSQKERHKALALRHYQRCLELNPRLAKYREIEPLLSAPAVETFRTLFEEKSTS